jgi:pimeloyl-ACP methyl ester carboxylesterase
MPAVLVHGVPETTAVWDPLRAELGRDDVVALPLPGFGCPRPDGFGSTKEEYVAWLVDEVAAIDGPVDLVGHDWGGGFVNRLVSTRPELVRTWVTDVAGIAHVDFEWHDIGKLWQTPGDGEAFFDAQLAMSIDERVAFLGVAGIPDLGVRAMAEAVDQTMADSILSLYRSALTVGQEWGPDFRDVPKPGLVLVAPEDALANVGRNEAAAANAGAPVHRLEGLAHWWLLEEPARGAHVLEDFWASV